MRLPALLLGAVLIAGIVVAGLTWWVRSGEDGGGEPGAGGNDEAGVEINYLDPDRAGEASVRLQLAGLEGLILVARRPGELLEFADLETLDGVTMDVDRQEPAIPALPDIAPIDLGLVLVDGDEAVLLSGGFIEPVGPADAVVAAGGNWVWLVRNVGGGELEAVLVDAAGESTESPAFVLAAKEVRAAPGLGILLEDELFALDEWDLGGAEILAGGVGGVLIREGDGYFTLSGPDADSLEVVVPDGLADAVFTALSPNLTHVVALDRQGAHLIELGSGDVITLTRVAASPLRYAWLPDGNSLVWTEAGRVFRLDIGSGEVLELGAATVAFSYGRLEVVEGSELS